MELISYIDLFEEQTLKIGIGMGFGLAFGFFSHTTQFCTRSAVIDMLETRQSLQLHIWLLAFLTALLFTQIFDYFHWIDSSQSRLFAQPQSLSGAVFGGTLFGIGMILARGCASRLLVLSASGNIRAAFTIFMVAATAYLTINGYFSKISTPLTSLASAKNFETVFTSENRIAITRLQKALVFILSGMGLLLTYILAKRANISGAKRSMAIVIGLLIPMAWAISSYLADILFDPLPVEGITYLRPLANGIDIALNQSASMTLSMDHGLIIGTISGAFISAVFSKQFHLTGFKSPNAAPFWRYSSGGILMGFGGVIAGGCTIGAGFSGGAILAFSALAALASMVLAAALTHMIVENRSYKKFQQISANP